MTEETAKGTVRRLTVSIIAIILLTAALSVTTFVLVVSTVSTEGHRFGTGSVRLNLNDGRPVISDGECVFEPGKCFEKDFTVENRSTCAVWYKLYFSNVDGAMANAIEVELRDGETVLAAGRLSELTEENTAAFAEGLEIGERKTLTIRFRFDETAGNDLMNVLLSFDFSARAVQAKNNPDRKFH